MRKKKKKVRKERNTPDKKIQKAETIEGKVPLAFNGMTDKEWWENGGYFACNLYEGKVNSPKEFEECLKSEVRSEYGNLPIREAGFCYIPKREEKMSRAARQRATTLARIASDKMEFLKFALAAIRQWKPDMFERLAKTMRGLESGKIFTPRTPGGDELRPAICLNEAVKGKKLTQREIAKHFLSKQYNNNDENNKGQNSAISKVGRLQRKFFKQTSDC